MRSASSPGRSSPRTARSDSHRLAVLAEHGAKDATHLAQGRVGGGATDEVRHQVGVRGAGPTCRLAQPPQRSLDLAGVALPTSPLQPGHVVLERALGHVEHRDRRVLALVDIAVDPDDPPLALVDLALKAVGGLGDLALRIALDDRLDHAPATVDLVQVGPGLPLDL